MAPLYLSESWFEILRKPLLSSPWKCWTPGADKVSSRLRKTARALKLAVRILATLPRVDAVLLNASVARAVYFGAFVGCAAALFERRSVVRIFGGGLAVSYARGGLLFRLSADLLFATSTILLQSKELMATFSRTHPRSRLVWFPTSRRFATLDEGPGQRREPGSPRRFVYAGEVRPEKGIETILDVFSRLGGGAAEIDLYGDLFEPYSRPWRGPGTWPAHVRYRGVVDSDTLRGLLSGYDALVMPTLLATEGYPGVIIEAFGAGCPVICSRIGGIPEIVDDSCGVLVDPYDMSGWLDAVNLFSSCPKLQVRMAQGARSKAREFDSWHWNCEVLGNLLGGGARSGIVP